MPAVPPIHTRATAAPSLAVYRADRSADHVLRAIRRVSEVGPVSASKKLELLSALAEVAVHPSIDRGAVR